MYEFVTSSKIIFGRGAFERLAEEVRDIGKKALIVTGKRFLKESGLKDRLEEILALNKIEWTYFDGIPSDPEVGLVDEGRLLARENGCDFVIGIGGGSSIDVAKAIAVLFDKPLKTIDYINGAKIGKKGIPCIAIPTTSGTGSEVTKNSVLTDPERRAKRSLRENVVLPDLAIVDPVLTLTLPPNLTVWTGLDALVQAIEAYVSKGSNPLTDPIALQASVLILKNITKAVEDGSNLDAREAMSIGSLMAGIALANARLGAVHGLAHPLGINYNIHHGLICGILLPAVIRFNMPIVEAKYASIYRAIEPSSQQLSDRECALRLLETVENLLDFLKIPRRLKEFGVKEEDLESIAIQSQSSESLRANPRVATPEDLVAIMKSIL
ncbi:iron-containing alcohol dehydrogenase [bacterium]|nr:iron-containing alcohol dehydrogenase [bacterium]